MLGGVGNVGTLGAKRRVIGGASGGGGGAQFLKSQGLTGTQGFTLNTLSVDLNRAMRLLTTTQQIPSGFNPKSPAGILTPSNSSFNRATWMDWGNDFFDDWGDWYIFNPADQTASYIGFTDPANINGADGTFFTETQTHHGKTFKIVHGYAAQGIFKLDIACTSDTTFQFALGHYGNMGSDGGTNNSDLTHTASWGTLYYNFNTDLGAENFYTHVIPKKQTDNDSINVDTTGLFTAIFSSDRLAIWTGYFTHGFTCYYIKGSNNSTGSMANWVANDIALSATYYD